MGEDSRRVCKRASSFAKDFTDIQWKEQLQANHHKLGLVPSELSPNVCNSE